MHLDKFYVEASVNIKQKIVGLNFPEKLIFEDGRIQTPKVNEVPLLFPEVSLRDKISNPLLQTLDAFSSLYQLVTGKTSF
jgi:hypothetical protein